MAYTSTNEKKAFEMPELLHNLNMLIDMTEEEIITKDRQLRYMSALVVVNLPVVFGVDAELME